MIFENLYCKIFESFQKYYSAIRDKFKESETPNNINIKKNISYGKNPENTFDVYYPIDEKAKKFTTILNIHGGGYVTGSKEQNALYAMILASIGYLVINMEYTNSQKEPFPKPVEEAFDLLKYISEDKKYKKMIDFDNFFISGDSAGGHIASLVANAQTSEILKYDLGLCGGAKIKGCILNSPTFTSFNFLNFPWLKNGYKRVIYGKDLNKVSKICSVTDTITSNFPPTIVFSANNDFIKMQADKFCKVAKDLDLAVDHYIFTTGKHLGHDFIINYPHLREGAYAICKIDEFIKNVKQNNLKKGVNLHKLNLNKNTKENANKNQNCQDRENTFKK